MPTPALDPNTADPDALVVERFFAALESLDLDAAMLMMSPNAVYQNVGTPAAHGRKQIRPYLGVMVGQLDVFGVEDCVYERRGNVIFTDRVDVFDGGGFTAKLRVQGDFVVRDGEIVSWIDTFSWPEFGRKMLASAPAMLRFRVDGLRRKLAGR